MCNMKAPNDNASARRRGEGGLSSRGPARTPPTPTQVRQHAAGRRGHAGNHRLAHLSYAGLANGGPGRQKLLRRPAGLRLLHGLGAPAPGRPGPAHDVPRERRDGLRGDRAVRARSDRGGRRDADRRRAAAPDEDGAVRSRRGLCRRRVSRRRRGCDADVRSRRARVSGTCTPSASRSATRSCRGSPCTSTR